MPLLTSDYISSLYAFKDANNIVLLQSFDENEEQLGVEQQKLIQGDMGIHVIDVNGTQWKSNLSAPVFIMPKNTSNQFDNLLNLVLAGYDNDDFMISPDWSDVSSVVKQISIKIDKEGVVCNAQILNDTGSITNWFIPSNNINYGNGIWISRLAQFYDTQLILEEWTHYGNTPIFNVFVVSGEITIDVDIKTHFFISTDPDTYNSLGRFIVTGYKVAGKLEIAYPFSSDANIEILESYKQKSQGKMFKLSVANVDLNLSKGNLVIKNIRKNLNPGKLTTVSLEFVSSATK